MLADALAEVLARPLADPFAAEVVAVPAKGVERWLAQRLSHRLGAPDGDGICAGVAFRSPAALVAESISGAVGGAPDADPWHPERAVWPLLEVIDAAADEPWCAVLHAHQRPQARPGPPAGRAVRRLRHPPARAAAGLAGGRVRGRRGSGVAARAVAAAARAHRRPRSRRAGRRGVRGAARRSRRRRRCPSGCRSSAPPGWPPQQLAVLAALAEHRDVHLWLPHPSPALWATVASYPASGAVPPRAADPTRRRGRATRCCPRSGATCASCRCGSPRPCPASSTSTTPAPTRRPRCWAGCSGGCATTGRRSSTDR